MTASTELETALTAFLSRFTPPRVVAGNPVAMAEEADQILNAFARFEPHIGFSEWWRQVTDELVRRMETRAWPLVSEVERACQAVRQSRQGGQGADAVEAMIIDHMETWFRRWKSQMPGYGNASRTMALIQRGVLANEREARFCGFALTEAMRQRAHEQEMGRDERDHHRRITVDLRILSERVSVNGADAKAKRETVIPHDEDAA